MLSAPGIGSGLDINSIISQLMSLERRPLEVLQQKEDGYQAQLSAYGKLKSAMSDLTSALDDLKYDYKFSDFAVNSSNESAFTATSSIAASVGSYNITVNNLATAHKLNSAAVADTATALGTGSLDISVGANSFSVTIDGSNNTLSGIRDAINDAVDNAGVNATILNDANGSRLILTSEETGVANAVTVTLNDDDGLTDDGAGLSQLLIDQSGVGTGPYTFDEIAAAEDAEVLVDGFTVTGSSNSISGAIEGVTLNLLKDGGQSGTLSLSKNLDTAEEKIKAFVDKYNMLKLKLDDFRANELKGDNTTVYFENQIRNEINTESASAGGAYGFLSEIGITTNKDTGLLELDSSELTDALNADLDAVFGLFGNTTDGFAVRLDSLLDGFVSADGLIDSRTDGLNARITRLHSRMDTVETRLVSVERRLIDQFSALDALVGQMNSTGSYLSQQLASLPNSNAG